QARQGRLGETAQRFHRRRRGTPVQAQRGALVLDDRTGIFGGDGQGFRADRRQRRGRSRGSLGSGSRAPFQAVQPGGRQAQGGEESVQARQGAAADQRQRPVQAPGQTG